MSVLVIQHAATETAGWWEEFLREADLPVTYLHAYRGDTMPLTAASFDAVIALGGPMNVWEEQKYPWLRDENALIQDCLRRATPYMGICLGAQLLAKAAGGEVTKAPVQEIGWYPVSLSPEGMEDPLFAGAPSRFPVFQWHEDTFSVPDNDTYGRGVRLATSDEVANQALRIGRTAYGLQFHVEVTPTMVHDWTAAHEGEVGRVWPQPVEAMRARSHELEPLMRERSRRIFENFCQMAQLKCPTTAENTTLPEADHAS